MNEDGGDQVVQRPELVSANNVRLRALDSPPTKQNSNCVKFLFFTPDPAAHVTARCPYGTVRRRTWCESGDDNNDNDNAWQRGPLWAHRMGPINTNLRYTYSPWQPLAVQRKMRPGIQRSRSHGCQVRCRRRYARRCDCSVLRILVSVHAVGTRQSFEVQEKFSTTAVWRADAE